MPRESAFLQRASVDPRRGSFRSTPATDYQTGWQRPTPDRESGRVRRKGSVRGINSRRYCESIYYARTGSSTDDAGQTRARNLEGAVILPLRDGEGMTGS